LSERFVRTLWWPHNGDAFCLLHLPKGKCDSPPDAPFLEGADPGAAPLNNSHYLAMCLTPAFGIHRVEIKGAKDMTKAVRAA